MIDALPAAFAFLLGVVMGSFGNVLILRLPENQSIVGRSRCPNCGHQLGAWENIPLISFLVLRAHCRKCERRISWQYPIIELLSGLLFLFAFWNSGTLPVAALLLALALWLLLLIGVVDMRTQLIPDALNLPFIAVAVLYAIANHSWSLPAVAIAGGFFLLQWVVSRGRWIGTGDILLGFGIGWLFDSPALALLFLFLAYVSGAIVASVFLLRKKVDIESRFAFGPFLSASAIVTALWGDRLITLLGF